MDKTLISVTSACGVGNSCYLLLRYGVVLKELGLKEKAVNVFVQAVEKEPLHWATWTEIALLCKTKEEVLPATNYYVAIPQNKVLHRDAS